MLVLGRKQGESISFGQDAYITVLEIRNSQVKLGIQMPDHIKILRSECDQPKHDQDPTCYACNGSGQGLTEDQLCRVCRGYGVY